MSKAREYIQESFSPGAQEGARKALRGVKEFLDKFKLQLNDRDIDILENAILVLFNVTMDENKK